MQRACGYKHVEKLSINSNSWHLHRAFYILDVYYIYIYTEIYIHTQTSPHSGIVPECQRSHIYSKETHEKRNSYKLIFKIWMIHFLKAA